MAVAVGQFDVLARAPNHLGDGVMALPAIEALCELGSVGVVAPRWGPDLYGHLSARVLPRDAIVAADVAVLFPPSFRVAWQARSCRRRIGVSGDWRRWLLTDVVAPLEHRADTYAALARTAGATPKGAPSLRSERADPDHIGLDPISPSGPPVEWTGFRQLADALVARGHAVVFYGGPGEDAAVAAIAGPHPRRVGLPLPAFADALASCAVFVGNDSGAAHYARACAVPTVVVHGSTTAARTGPAGAYAVEGPDLPCRPCYRKRCRYALECLDIGVDRVLRAVEERLG